MGWDLVYSFLSSRTVHLTQNLNHHQVLLSHYYGATRTDATKQAVSGETQFAIGSVSKIFTLVDALRQQEVWCC